MEKAVKRYAPIFVLPTFLAFVIGFILPFIEGLYLSFCQFTTVKDAKFIGIGNYQRIFTDSTFTNSFKFTVLFAVASIVLINVPFSTVLLFRYLLSICQLILSCPSIYKCRYYCIPVCIGLICRISG